MTRMARRSAKHDMARAQAADAVMLAAVGGPKWANVPYDVRPEAGLLRLRKDLGLFANLRPAVCYPALADASALKREIVEGLDIMIVRELTGGVYFGEPKEIIDLGNGQKRAIDTQVYDTYEIERIAARGFRARAQARQQGDLVGKAQCDEVRRVVEGSRLRSLHAKSYPDVKLEHMLADALGMQLVRWPKQFDVIVTDNLFGDMLSDVASMLTGSLGMLPSASLGEADAEGKRKAMYEPVHGSAPGHRRQGHRQSDRHDRLFRHGSALFLRPRRCGRPVEKAIADVLAAGLRTADIKGDATADDLDLGHGRRHRRRRCGRRCDDGVTAAFCGGRLMFARHFMKT